MRYHDADRPTRTPQNQHRRHPVGATTRARALSSRNRGRLPTGAGDSGVQGAPILLPPLMGDSLLTPATDVDVTNQWITDASIMGPRRFLAGHSLFDRSRAWFEW